MVVEIQGDKSFLARLHLIFRCTSNLNGFCDFVGDIKGIFMGEEFAVESILERKICDEITNTDYITSFWA